MRSTEPKNWFRRKKSVFMNECSFCCCCWRFRCRCVDQRSAQNLQYLFCSSYHKTCILGHNRCTPTFWPKTSTFSINCIIYSFEVSAVDSIWGIIAKFEAHSAPLYSIEWLRLGSIQKEGDVSNPISLEHWANLKTLHTKSCNLMYCCR